MELSESWGPPPPETEKEREVAELVEAIYEVIGLETDAGEIREADGDDVTRALNALRIVVADLGSLVWMAQSEFPERMMGAFWQLLNERCVQRANRWRTLQGAIAESQEATKQ